MKKEKRIIFKVDDVLKARIEKRAKELDMSVGRYLRTISEKEMHEKILKRF